VGIVTSFIGRRKFIAALVGGATAAWPLAARAQQRKLPILGFLTPGSQAAYGKRVAACLDRLKELGWIEGRTVEIDYRWAETQRFDEVIADFVQRKVALILTAGTPPVLAAQKATSGIPIVFIGAGDPVGSGLVASLARPGGNTTGLSNLSFDIAGKRVALLRELVPGIRKLAVMARIDNVSAASEMRAAASAARALGIEAVPLEIRQAEDISSSFEFTQERPDALYVAIDSLVTTQARRLNTLATGAKLPTMHGARELVDAGGLMSYGANFPELYRRAADYIDKILRGVKPADIPVEQPTKFDLVVNLTAAKALGLKIPESFLLRADEVIE
jgi:putative ABC transport system substrate-binding protein